MWYVYVCEKDGQYYTGITTDLAHRLRQHGNPPLRYHEPHSTKQGAAHREREIKGWSRTKKEKLWSAVNQVSPSCAQDKFYPERSEGSPGRGELIFQSSKKPRKSVCPSLGREIRRPYLLLVILFFCGCGTGYKKAGLIAGGYDEVNMEDGVSRVSYRGEPETNPDRVRDFAFLRCSEVALAKGYKYFVIKNRESKETQIVTVDKGSSKTFYEPTVFLTMKCLKERLADTSSTTIYDAEQVNYTIRSRYHFKPIEPAASKNK